MLSRAAIITGRVLRSSSPLVMRGRVTHNPSVTSACLQAVRCLSLGDNNEKPVFTDEGMKEFNYDLDLIYSPPDVPEIEEQVVNSVEECKHKEPLEDQMAVWFGPSMPTINEDKDPRRDVVNFPRLRPDVWPEATRLFIIPDNWFRFMYERTGVTGPYCLVGGVLTFLISKELLILEHEMLTGLSFATIFWYAFRKWGDLANRYFEGIIDSEVYYWHQWQKGCIDVLDRYIALEKQGQESLKGQNILFEAKRENVNLQREAEYRRRLMTAFNEVKRKLDYQIAAQNSQKQFSQKHMVDWIIQNVSKGITVQQEKDTMTKCIIDLKALSSARAGVI